jgi:hypothetical protein
MPEVGEQYLNASGRTLYGGIPPGASCTVRQVGPGDPSFDGDVVLEFRPLDASWWRDAGCPETAALLERWGWADGAGGVSVGVRLSELRRWFLRMS